MKPIKIDKTLEAEILAEVDLGEAITANLKLKKLGIFEPEETESGRNTFNNKL